ncbi:hypothetical protein L0U88_14690 [Flavihumibacter sp. RY-1]|uniref:Parallel beta helix pectate lyase-like protein n=1 Tax=Flavihumibacter fluminis TaxID=2909236 RepID=A0ABS9BM17_9BACT|nr:choice-of-anchor Q domain-containing protein [Flavihumibacter fluminis]MCF1715884.1 hypothetical protein [Flavihumibacter fluminis]
MGRFLWLFIFSMLIISCSKDSLLTSSDAPLGLSADSLHFDTVFTTAGSITQSFRIINNNDQRIRISSIRLAGSNTGVFRMNVNGEPGPLVEAVEIAAGDSAHVFVNLQIPANSETLPFLVRDSISIQWNGQEKWIQLDAYGQNARYIRNGIISSNTSWDNSLPYVLIGPFTIEENTTLSISKGTRIYVHADAPILVKGSLQAAGDTAQTDRVVFTGDRLDQPYAGFPASWPGIYFTNTSHTNRFAYTNIRNAYQAVVLEGRETVGEYKLEMDQVIIDNAFDAGLLCINSSVRANNLLISNCGKNLQIGGGGKYNFNHATLAAYSNNLIVHKDPVVLISNSVLVNGNPVQAALEAFFRNSIIWSGGGTVENEMVALREGTQPYLVRFETGIWKMSQPVQHIEVADTETNLDPQFELLEPGSGTYNFRLKDMSPAIDRGIITGTTLDLDGKKRPVGMPDLGAYEKQ